MNDLSDLLELRAKEVGERQLLLEVAAVLAAHAEYYYQEPTS